MCIVQSQYLQSQTLPSGGQWGCPSIPTKGDFDTTCFKRASELKLGQGFFTHYGTSDPVYFIIPQNRPSYALAIAVGWNYFRNVIGTDAMSINQWSATMVQENGFAAYPGVQLPSNIYDVEVGGTVPVPCTYPRGCNSNTCGGAGYCWHVGQNGNDGAYHNTLAGYQTAAPYFPQRFKTPESFYHPYFNSNIATATMAKTFYDMSIYRRAQLINNIDLAAAEAASPDPYGVEAALAIAYNLGPNASNSVGLPTYSLAAGSSTNSFWAGAYFQGPNSNYAERVSSITAVLDNNENYAKTRCSATQCPNVADWDFYSFYDSQISWDTVSGYINQLLRMYPEVNVANFKAAVKPAFDKMDPDGNGTISYRYEMGAVIDAITLNIPKEDPGFSVTYAINGTGCKLNCRAPYAVIKPQGSTKICPGQSVTLLASVDGATASTSYQWFKDGVSIPGATNVTYDATTTGVYSIVVCWNATNELNNATVKCCSKPECEITVTQNSPCGNCVINMALIPTSNNCTGQPDGNIKVDFNTTEVGPFIITWSSPWPGFSGSTEVAFNNGSYTIPNRRDGKYAIEIRRKADANCRNAKDALVIPITVIKESLDATKVIGNCGTQLNANIVSQRPTACRVKVNYGSLALNSWDKAFSMELQANSQSLLYMYEAYTSLTDRDNPWDFSPFSWPSSNAPNTAFIDINDGDVITVTGTVTVPLGTAFNDFFDGGVRLGSTSNPKATFTNMATLASDTFGLFRYKPPTTSSLGTRTLNNSFRVNCPVVSPPAYIFSWSPGTGLTNAGIKNPISSHNVNAGILYTATATHPVNTNCKLTDTVFVPKNCLVLPVDLLYFNASLQAKEVELIWGTSSQENFSHFVIEKSRNGNDFYPLYTTLGQEGNTVRQYKFIDNQLSNDNYYRLKLVNNDGSYSYSQVERVRTEIELSVVVQPNPFEGESVLKILSPIEKELVVKIFNIQGMLIQESTVLSSNTLTLGKEFSQGVYILQISDQEHNLFEKIIKR